MKNFIIGLCLISPSILFGQLDRSIKPKAGIAPTINIKDSEVFKTSNGITVILSENHKLPRVTFDLVMGSTPKAYNKLAGLSDVAGSLILSGTKNRTKDEIDGEIDYIGASLNADNNSISMSCLTKHMDKGLSVMSDVLMNVNFPEDEVNRIIKQFESSLISAKSDGGTIAKNVMSKVIYPMGHPYGEVMTEATLSNINRTAIVDYYNDVFTPNGSYLVVIGDITKAEVEKAVNNYFSEWTGGNIYNTMLTSNKLNDGNRVFFVNKPGAVQSVVYISFPIDIKAGHEDYLKLKVLNGILGGGGFGTRLMQNLREDKAYTYGCYSSLNVNQNGSYLSAGGNFRNEVTDSAITQILFEIEKLITEDVLQSELSLTKSSMAGGFARSLESPATVARFALSIIKDDLPKDYYQTYLQKLDAVSISDLKMVAKKYFTSTKANIIVVGNEEVVEKLKAFDSDKKIEKLDAFANEVVDRIPADISAEELLSKYTSVIADGSEGKALAKKMKKTKSYEEVIEYTMEQMPFPMTSTKVWMKPSFEGTKMEGNGMAFQKSYFDGTTGAEWNMQTGSKTMTDEAISSKKKSFGIIPEMNYSLSGMNFELIGIENFNGKACYVLKLDDGDSETYDYFDKETFYKVQTISIKTVEGETQESTIGYSNYKVFGGFLFPTNINVSIGEMNLSGTLKSMTINAKVDISKFK